jgi:hypothetical protein
MLEFVERPAWLYTPLARAAESGVRADASCIKRGSSPAFARRGGLVVEEGGT